MTEVYYRLSDESGDEDNVCLCLHRFTVVKTTPKGVWLNVYDRPKFVLRDAWKKFAHPTFEDAVISFMARKSMQQRILAKQYDDVVRIQETIAAMNGSTGLIEYIKKVPTKYSNVTYIQLPDLS